ncbi:hypothetical protein JCM3765_006377 [Sporobolomyces pararoseus]
MFDQSLSLSDTLGGLSILTWLGAQSPQIYENYKNKSVEGLALPFLISWFWGDFTNFIGCVLTHQLPFQTYLASYFLIVDVLLVSQYYYYSRHGKPPLNLPPLSESFPYAQAPTTTHPHHPTRRPSSSSRKRSLSTRRSNSYIHQHPHHHQHQHQHQHHREDGGDSNNNLKNSFMSETTSSIKGGTGETSSRGFSSSSSRGGSSNRIRQFSNPNSNPSTSSSSSLLHLVDNNNTFSSSSEQQQQRGRTLIRNSNLMIGGGTFDPTLSTIYGSPSVTLPPPPPPQLDTQSQSQHVSFNPSSSTPSSISSSSSVHHYQNDQNHHHHYHHPAATEVEEIDRYTTHELRRTTSSRSSTSRPRPPISRANTASGLVFLSIGLLFTIGSNLQSGGGGSSFQLVKRGSGGGEGEAWSTSNSQITKMEEEREESLGGGKMIEIRWKGDEMFSDKNEIERVVVVNPSSTSVSISSSTLKEGNQDQDRDDTRGGEGSGPDYERIIGRTSAWLCTTLYLTSRLPQIWRNFRRRSVEGLAMTLFFFAFVGNTLYVLSILTNPLKKTDPGYLVESTPYLLGSGGTVCFDLMILFQSLIYSSSNGSHSSRKRGKRLLLTSREEEEGLLEEEGGEGEGEGETDLESETTMGRRRGRRSRDSSLKSFRSGSRRSISRQSQSHRGGNQLSMTRSRSTDHFFTTPEREREREEQTPRRMTPSRVNSSNSRDSLSLRREETILEAGESAVTVRT